jgi:general secretion pathway protein J
VTAASARSAQHHDAGFTLIEVVVALALFAIIAVAGVALVNTVLDTRQRTAGRLNRLADLQRAMVVVTRDFTELADAPLTGGAASVGFDRHAGSGVSRPSGGGAMIGVSYRLDGAVFERIANGRTQVVLDHVAAVRWTYYALGGWQDHWPATVAQARGWPIAVAVEVDLAGPGLGGTLRRVVDLPVRPLPPGAVAAP